MSEAAVVQPAAQRVSRLGKRAITVPKGVTVTVQGAEVGVKGPKGTLSRVFPAGVVVELLGDTLRVTSTASGRDAARLQGLGRALLAAMVKGAATGYEKILDLVGTGYRVELKGKMMHFALGLSHAVIIELPAGVTAVIPPESKGAALVLTSADKEVLGQLAATIRSKRPPEPYGGKGVRYRGEQIRRKAGKAGKGRK